jgi:uncharacterized membrane protein
MGSSDILVEKSGKREGYSMNEKETGRLEAFSDGVFAVAITLLVLNIKIPDANAGDLWGAFFGQWQLLVAYVISFFTIGVMWLNHHRLFQHIKRVDTGLMLLNILLLAVIVFIPVPTALLAEYLTLPNQNAAAVIYTGTCLIMAICFDLLWLYASHHNRLLGKNVDTQAVAAITRQYSFGPLSYLIVFGLAWISTPAAAIGCFILALFFALPGRSLPLVAPASSSAGEAGGGEGAEIADGTEG